MNAGVTGVQPDHVRWIPLGGLPFTRCGLVARVWILCRWGLGHVWAMPTIGALSRVPCMLP